ncbi:hypothetical protein A5742_14685 [Mycolicibacterium fortuitum]|uniref:Prokaryotic cytochrome C oxidase subunit IV family protein n=1 Tax=Mycolicibacterium fortuitum TaxID=1766 RepID=A0ABD6QC85_MYCFO|nr:cytochrome C oxidase subunit IV family protein [Mycolicibacterium fortuitum]OMC33136.1 hypothetical protein A5742_14685 [Mycolicibacterium fortuitum]
MTQELIRTRTNLVWLILVGATLVSWGLGSEHDLGQSGQHLASVVILLIAFLKIRYIGLYFMELKDAPILLRGAFEAYCVVVCAMTVIMFLVA